MHSDVGILDYRVAKKCRSFMFIEVLLTWFLRYGVAEKVRLWI